MNIGELKKKLYELTALYFKGASVVWGSTRTVKPNAPLVVLNIGGITRPYQPVTQTVNGILRDGYPSKTVLQIDLYTKGAIINTALGVTASYDNTAVNDLMEFINFINSAYVDEWSEINDISLLANQVQDLTGIINDTTWEYRAMAEVEVGFTQTAVGYSALMYDGGAPYYDNGNPKYDPEGYPVDENGGRLPEPPLDVDDEGKPIYPSIEQSPSGGGSQTIADATAGWFEQVEPPEIIREE